MHTRRKAAELQETKVRKKEEKKARKKVRKRSKKKVRNAKEEMHEKSEAQKRKSLGGAEELV